MVWSVAGKSKYDPVRVEKAFPAIVSKTKFRRVMRLMRTRAPKVVHPRRVGSTYLLSGLVKCKACNRALSGQDAKSGKFSYYVCQSIMKHGKDACETPRLNARQFEEMVVGKIRSNVLTDGNIRALVKVVDEQMDGVAAEQRERLETIEEELEDVKRKLGRIWHFIETADDIDMADAPARIREHRDRQERLEEETADAKAILSQRRAALDDVDTIAAYAQDMSDFLKTSELTERRAFIETFVKRLFGGLRAPESGHGRIYEAARIARHSRYRVGRDHQENPAILIETTGAAGTATLSDFEGRHLRVGHGVNCTIKEAGVDVGREQFSVVRLCFDPSERFQRAMSFVEWSRRTNHSMSSKPPLKSAYSLPPKQLNPRCDRSLMVLRPLTFESASHPTPKGSRSL